MAALFAALAIGALCYRYVESPLLHLWRRPRTEVPAATCERAGGINAAAVQIEPVCGGSATLCANGASATFQVRHQ